MISVGIDPGKSGGIAVMQNNKIRDLVPYSDTAVIEICEELQDNIHNDIPVKCCLEKVGAMPGQGVVSMFSFGQTFGFIRGVLEAFYIPYQLVPPQRWKKEFTITKDKTTAVEACQRLFPGVNLLATDKCKRPHDGMAEALLMAEYARRKL
jgi:crossover junction endodeoxyribonuclease RuvC